MRVRTALEFARNAGEVPRSDAARELWATVYPELSEGKPGLLGAITATSRATVPTVKRLRLSYFNLPGRAARKLAFNRLDAGTQVSVADR
jgi:hypothetical protein